MKEKYCLNCGKLLNRKQKKFCSRECQQEYNYKEYIKKWKNGEVSGLKGSYGISNHIRKYLCELLPPTQLCCLEVGASYFNEKSCKTSLNL